MPRILRTFAATTGIPAFLMSEDGVARDPSPGFPLEDYAFADLDELRNTVLSGLSEGWLVEGRHHTLYTEHQFVYNVVKLKATDAEPEVCVAGPMRIHRRIERYHAALSGGVRDEVDRSVNTPERTARLPNVSISRVAHLGLVQAALCRGYSEEGSLLPAGGGLGVVDGCPSSQKERESVPGEILPVSFTLVEEESHVPYELMTRVRDLVVAGDVEGVRELWRRSPPIPVDRLIQTDPVKSIRYNVIATCALLVGVVLDRDLPYEEVMKTADRYIRQADQSDDVNVLLRLMFGAIEGYARLARRYSARNYSKAVRQVLHYIQTNLANRIGLQELANLVGLSPTYVSRLIRRETGSNLAGLVHQFRVEESKYLLLHTEHSIFQIARMVGFRYQNHFARRFKLQTGMTPTRFRRTKRSYQGSAGDDRS